MKKTIMIKRRYEFKNLYLKGKFFFGKNITMYIIKNNLNINKLGIAVGKKSGKAVERNKIKRLIRENYKEIEPCVKCGYNILFSVNKKCDLKNINFYDVKKDFEKMIKSSEIWLGNNEENNN